MNIDPGHLEHLAAKRLATSQSALSGMVTNPETRPGIRLFERYGRPLIPAEAGTLVPGTRFLFKRKSR